MRDLEKESPKGASSGTLTPFPDGRRALLGGISVVGIGLLGAASVPADPMAPSSEATPSTAKVAAVSCARNNVVASEEATEVETISGKIRGFNRNRVYTFKGMLYCASTSGAARFMPPAKPEPWIGIRNELAYRRLCPQEVTAEFNTDGNNLASHGEDAFLLTRC